MTEPVLANLPLGGDLGCNPTEPTCADTVTASDNCDGDISDDVVCTPMDITGDDCNKAQTFMYTVEDECGNADTAYVYYTWKVDTIAPVFTSVAPFMDSLCNASPTDTLWAYWTDNCTASDSSWALPTLFESATCYKIWEYAFTAADACGNESDTSVYVLERFDLVGDKCETVFGRLPNDEDLISFCELEMFNRWGWTNNITVPDSTYVMNLYAGAAHCDTTGRTPVGTVEVRWYSDGDSVTVDYAMIPGQYLSEIHVYVGYDQYPTLSKGKKPKPTVAPGQYTVVVEGDGSYTGAHVVVTNVQEAFWIIAHGVACELECVCTGEVGEGGILSGSGEIYPAFEGTVYRESMLDNPNKKKSAELATDVTTLELGDLKVYPNPFNDVVNIEFVSPVDGHAVLEIYNMVGQRVVRLLDDYIEAGVENKVQFRPDAEVSGIYLYKLDIDGDIQIGKIIYRRE